MLNEIILNYSKLWVVIDLITRTLVPSVFGIVRNPTDIVDNVKKQLFPTVVAFLANSISRSLASVPKIPFPRITEKEYDALETEKCVECLVLSEPANTEIAADVIFIHGLHGSIDKTWRQGTWRDERHKLNQQSPVRRISTGNLYVPARQKSLRRSLVDIYSKIPNKTPRIDTESCVTHNNFKSDPDDTSEQTGKYSTCWPKDWIQQDCPNVRVIAVNYSTDVLWSPIWAKKRHR